MTCIGAYDNITALIRTIQLARFFGGDRLISLNYRDSKPIYEQIRVGLINMISTGALNPGDKLQSVRELATQLAINPNTIQRAYRELEAEGFIYSVAGKGSFVADKREIVEGRKRKLMQSFDDIVSQLSECGVGTEELVKRITEGGNKK